jgi:hypothetical protein
LDSFFRGSTHFANVLHLSNSVTPKATQQRECNQSEPIASSDTQHTKSSYSSTSCSRQLHNAYTSHHSLPRSYRDCILGISAYVPGSAKNALTHTPDRIFFSYSFPLFLANSHRVINIRADLDRIMISDGTEIWHRHIT